jgi:sulfur transfer complex TusBCD TusB component (DsrH family)
VFIENIVSQVGLKITLSHQNDGIHFILDSDQYAKLLGSVHWVFNSEDQLLRYLKHQQPDQQIVLPLPHLQNQITTNCGYVTLALAQMSLLRGGLDFAPFYPAHPTDVIGFEGGSLMHIGHQLDLLDKYPVPGALADAADLAFLASYAGRNSTVYEFPSKNILRDAVHRALIHGYPVAIAFDVKAGIPVPSGFTGIHAHWGLVIGRFKVSNLFYLIMAHGHDNFYCFPEDFLYASCGNLREHHEIPLRLSNQIVIIYPKQIAENPLGTEWDRYLRVAFEGIPGFYSNLTSVSYILRNLAPCARKPKTAQCCFNNSSDFRDPFGLSRITSHPRIRKDVTVPPPEFISAWQSRLMFFRRRKYNIESIIGMDKAAAYKFIQKHHDEIIIVSSEQIVALVRSNIAAAYKLISKEHPRIIPLFTAEQIELLKQVDNCFAGLVSELAAGNTDILALLESSCLLTDNGVRMLMEGKITPEQAAAMPDNYYPQTLLTDNGVRMLMEGRITTEQAAAMPNYYYLQKLLTDKGVQMLMEGKITPEQAASMPNDYYLQKLLTDNGVRMLTEGKITPEQAASMPDDYYLLTLLTDNGVRMLMEGRITPEQAAAMGYSDLQKTVKSFMSAEQIVYTL